MPLGRLPANSLAGLHATQLCTSAASGPLRRAQTRRVAIGHRPTHIVEQRQTPPVRPRRNARQSCETPRYTATACLQSSSGRLHTSTVDTQHDHRVRLRRSTSRKSRAQHMTRLRSLGTGDEVPCGCAKQHTPARQTIPHPAPGSSNRKVVACQKPVGTSSNCRAGRPSLPRGISASIVAIRCGECSCGVRRFFV